MARLRHFLAVLGFIGATTTHAAIIANSIVEFSAVQGQDNWTYGFYLQGGAGPHGYTSAAFASFGTFNVSRWEATDAQVGANNNDFLNLNMTGGHPTGLGPESQDAIIWAIRRYSAEIDGLIRIDFDLHKENTTNPRGGGVTGRIFVNGVERFTGFIANDDGVGVQQSLLLNVSVGDLIDFAIDPSGVAPVGSGDGDFSARADGSHFSAIISSGVLPIPSSFALLFAGALAGFALRAIRT